MKITKKIRENVGMLPPSIRLVDTETINMNIDGVWEDITLDDVKNYGSNGMSGLRSFGPVVGDWRMIDAIYNDAYAVFERMGNKL